MKDKVLVLLETEGKMSTRVIARLLAIDIKDLRPVILEMLEDDKTITKCGRGVVCLTGTQPTPPPSTRKAGLPCKRCGAPTRVRKKHGAKVWDMNRYVVKRTIECSRAPRCRWFGSTLETFIEPAGVDNAKDVHDQARKQEAEVSDGGEQEPGKSGPDIPPVDLSETGEEETE